MISTSSAGLSACGVSCVIPAFNEEANIRGVLSAVVNHPLVNQVIVVDDGSTDSTAAVVGTFADVNLISLGGNTGKSRALYKGITKCTGTVIMLLDGDLVGLTASDVTALIRPVLQEDADISISLRRNAPRIWRLIGLDYISGERVFRRDMLAHRVEDVPQLPRFGFEVFLNKLCIERMSRVAIVYLAGVDSPHKSSKHGIRKGLKADVCMLRDILKTVSVVQIAAQIVSLRRLRV